MITAAHQIDVFVLMHWLYIYICAYIMCVADNMEGFLTLAERHYIVKYELDALRAQKDMKVPGLPESFTLKSRQNVCEYSTDFSPGLRKRM